jgi:hypothetical protein
MITYHRPAIQNGQIARRSRRVAPTAIPASPRARQNFDAATRAVALTGAREESHSAAMPVLIICGLLLASGFVYGLSQHFTAAGILRDRVQLRTELEQARTEQRSLEIRDEEEHSPAQLERRLGSGELVPVSFDQSVRHAANHETTGEVKVQDRVR